MSILTGKEPALVWKYFEEICAIPHGSGNMQPISDYCAAFAKAHGLSYLQDDMYNIIITKPATAGYEAADPIILQGHLDMVCEKTRTSTIDFTTQGLTLETDGTLVWAKDTTLGGDDGIAVAYALAVLASTELKHPKIEVVLTVDEEIGLLGAEGIDLSSLSGRKLINLDSEEEGIFLTSCAGGNSLDAYLPVKRERGQGIPVKLTVTGLHGGHSGCEIQMGYANANVLLARTLYFLSDSIAYQIAHLEGGSKGNAIPRHAEAILRIAPQDFDALETAVAQQAAILQAEYAVTEPTLTVTVGHTADAYATVVTDADAKMLCNALLNLPNGIQAMSADIAGLVETSLNLGVMELGTDELHLLYAVRSAKASAMEYLTRRTCFMVECFGGHCTVSGAYPAWEYRRESPLREAFITEYRRLFGKEPEVQAIHAGLECGMFVNQLPDLDCISLGPDMKGVHTYEETLDIASTERVWKLLTAVLENAPH